MASATFAVLLQCFSKSMVFAAKFFTQFYGAVLLCNKARVQQEFCSPTSVNSYRKSGFGAQNINIARGLFSTKVKAQVCGWRFRSAQDCARLFQSFGIFSPFSFSIFWESKVSIRIIGDFGKKQQANTDTVIFAALAPHIPCSLHGCGP